MPTIEASYYKKIGLPGYSSHSYSVTVRTEVDDVGQVEKQSNQLYVLLQETVDKNIQEEGFVPEPNGHDSAPEPSYSNANGSGNHRGNGRSSSSHSGDYWKCSDKQKDLVLKIVDEHRLDKHEIEDLAKDMFGKPVKALNKMEASGLIEELLEKYGPSKSNGNGNRNGSRSHSYQRGGNRR